MHIDRQTNRQAIRPSYIYMSDSVTQSLNRVCIFLLSSIFSLHLIVEVKLTRLKGKKKQTTQLN